MPAKIISFIGAYYKLYWHAARPTRYNEPSIDCISFNNYLRDIPLHKNE